MALSTRLIALMGATGSGKSSFVNAILGMPVTSVGEELNSQTLNIDEYSYNMSGIDICIVDTPGFNDSIKSDTETLKMIAGFMKAEHDFNQKFSGIIFLHNITAAKGNGMAHKDMTIFKKLCGADSIKNVVILTTFWDSLRNIQDGVDRECELKEDKGLLKELCDGGAKFYRSGHFASNPRPQGEQYPTPQEVVDHLLSLDPVFLQIQKEMAAGMSVEDTAAGIILQEFDKPKQEAGSTKKMIDAIQQVNTEDRRQPEDLQSQFLADHAEKDIEKSRLTEELGEVRAKLQKAEVAHAEKDTEKSRLTEELGEVRAKLQKAEADHALELKALRTELEKANAERDALQSANEKLEHDLRSARSSVNAATTSRESIFHSAKAKLERELQTARSSFNATIAERDILQSAKAGLEKEVLYLREENRRQGEQFEQHETEIRKLREELANMRSQQVGTYAPEPLNPYPVWGTASTPFFNSPQASMPTSNGNCPPRRRIGMPVPQIGPSFPLGSEAQSSMPPYAQAAPMYPQPPQWPGYQ